MIILLKSTCMSCFPCEEVKQRGNKQLEVCPLSLHNLEKVLSFVLQTSWKFPPMYMSVKYT